MRIAGLVFSLSMTKVDVEAKVEILTDKVSFLKTIFEAVRPCFILSWF